MGRLLAPPPARRAGPIMTLVMIRNNADERPVKGCGRGGGRMKVSRERFAENRARIVDAASRLFREKGFDGVGLDAVMEAAGLTHGAFYGHFASKEDLIAQACAAAFAHADESWRAAAAPRRKLARLYLAEDHCA